MPFEQLRHVLSFVQKDAAFRHHGEQATTADEVARWAPHLGYRVCGGDILRFSGQSSSGIRVQRSDHPGDYSGRDL